MSEARYLARGVGYVDHPGRGLRGAGEALSEDDQAAVTAAVRQAAEDDRRAGLRMQAERAEKSLAHYQSLARHAERELARIRRRLAG